MDRHMPAGSGPITFVVSGEDQTLAATPTRGAASPQAPLDLPRGRVKHAVRVGSQRAGGGGARVEAVPG